MFSVICQINNTSYDNNNKGSVHDTEWIREIVTIDKIGFKTHLFVIYFQCGTYR